MSTYTDKFESHPFHSAWNQLKETIESIDTKGLNPQTIEDFARFKKVAYFIDTLLENIDPELIPLNMLDGLNSHLSNCISNLNTFVSNKNQSHLQEANKRLDDILSNVKAQALCDTKLKRSLQNAIKAYIDEIDKHLEHIVDTEQEYEKAKEFREQIESYHDELFEDIDDEISVKSQITEFVDKLEHEYIKINDYYNELLIDDENESTKTLIEEAKKEILEDTEEANNKLIEVSSKIEELDKFYVKIFGSLNEDDKREGGLKQELETRAKELDKYRDTQEKLFEKMLSDKKAAFDAYEQEQMQKQKSLFEQIESLLPGATSAGLAKAYQARRVLYKKPIIVWNAVFIIALIGMFVAGYVTLQDFKSWEDTLKHLLHYAPLYIPAIWLAIYASKRRSESRALEEEYAHKEALAKSYSSYKKQIEELDQEDQVLMEKLLGKTIDTVSENPSKALDKKHGDNSPIMEAIEKITPNKGDK